MRMLASWLFAADSPPLTPDAQTARNWLEGELRNPVYHERESWVSILLRRISDWLSGLSGASFNPWTLLALVGGLLLVVGAAYFVVGPMRRTVAARKDGGAALLDPSVSGREYLARARASAARGEFALAAADAFRATIKTAEENVLISVAPGRTASEAASALGAACSPLAAEVLWAASVFDAVEYGAGTADAVTVTRMVALQDAVAHARPSRQSRVSRDSHDSQFSRTDDGSLVGRP